MLRHQEELTNVHLQYDYANGQLEKLNKTNALNDTFRISHEGPFGTINGLRLGKLPSQHVEWSEINAAMGHTALLLETVSIR